MIDPVDQKCKSLIGGRCDTSLDCGKDAGCDGTKCYCEFGYVPDKDNFGCLPVNCSSNQDCISKCQIVESS